EFANQFHWNLLLLCKSEAHELAQRPSETIQIEWRTTGSGELLCRIRAGMQTSASRIRLPSWFAK
ncbi:MAG TPA: hypothetical protein VFE08_06155, partial [Candidatus Sulfotelmatobacter sp.]|nr:hypothetical protein [Candidatus Sulfotelmatobacter sp.]